MSAFEKILRFITGASSPGSTHTSATSTALERQRADSIDDFADILVRSGLATEEQVGDLVERFQEQRTATSAPDTITAFCTVVVAAEVLTTWQCEKLRNGQWKGFFDIDGFVMLDNLGPDADYGYYLAREISTGAIVRLKVTPRNRWKDTDIEYSVDRRFT